MTVLFEHYVSPLTVVLPLVTQKAVTIFYFEVRVTTSGTFYQTFTSRRHGVLEPQHKKCANNKLVQPTVAGCKLESVFYSK
jgi:membrane protein insertase Oxa1/YidC/SpoIIIJ